MRKILLTIGAVIFVGGAVAGATGAFYSDTETSTGNIIVAGTIDLTVDSFGSTVNNTNIVDADFPATDLTDEVFFAFGDIKPGDFGWRDVSLHTEDNPAWACLFIDNKQDDENTPVEPEIDAGDNLLIGIPNGELSQEMELFAWEDRNPDGIYEPGPDEADLLGGPDSFSNIFAIPFSDSVNGVPILEAPFANSRNVGLFWCAGTITVDLGGSLIKPGLSGSTLECNGAGMSDIAQTDIFTADVVVYAEQTRNNDNFVCSGVVLP